MRWPLQPLQPLQKTQLRPAFGPSVDSLCPSVDSLCHPGFTTTNLSYRFQILKLPPPPCAVLLVDNINMYIYIIICIYIHMYTVLSVVAAFERSAATFRFTFKIAKFSSSCLVLLWRDALCNVNVRQRLCHPAKTNDNQSYEETNRLHQTAWNFDARHCQAMKCYNCYNRKDSGSWCIHWVHVDPLSPWSHSLVSHGALEVRKPPDWNIPSEGQIVSVG